MGHIGAHGLGPRKRNILLIFLALLEVNLPYDLVRPSVGGLVGLSFINIGALVYGHVLKRL